MSTKTLVEISAIRLFELFSASFKFIITISPIAKDSVVSIHIFGTFTGSNVVVGETINVTKKTEIPVSQLIRLAAVSLNTPRVYKLSAMRLTFDL